MSEAIAKPRGRPEAATTRYEDDLYTWVQEQVALLRAGHTDEIDADNIAGELRDVGTSEYRTLESALVLILTHMLKWDFQPARRSRSRDNTIATQRLRYGKTLSENPGLTSRREEALEDAYAVARNEASSDTNLPRRVFPEACPYGWADILERAFDFDGTGDESP